MEGNIRQRFWITGIGPRIFLGVIFFILIGCHREKQSAEQAIVYWSSNNNYEIEFARAVVADWNRLHPDVPVKTQPVPEGQSSEEVILAAVVGKTTPDIYSNMWQGDVAFYASSGVLVALDTIPGFLEFLRQRCDSATLQEVTAENGHIYQIPWKMNPIMMIYNRKALREIGFPRPPQTYSRFLEAARRFSRDADGDGYVDHWIGYTNVSVTWWQRLFDFYPLYLAASGGAPLVRGNRVMFENAHAVEVFRFLKTLFEKNYFPREQLSARQDAFLSGIVATRITGPWDIMHVERFKPKGFEYAFTSVPRPDECEGPVYTYCDPKNIVIFNTCTRPQQAVEFVKFMLSEKNDFRLLEMTRQLPRRRDLFSSDRFMAYFLAHPRMLPFARQARYIRGTDNSPVLKEIFDAISQEFEACVVYGTKSPEQAIHDAATAAQLLLK